MIKGCAALLLAPGQPENHRKIDLNRGNKSGTNYAIKGGVQDSAGSGAKNPEGSRRIIAFSALRSQQA